MSNLNEHIYAGLLGIAVGDALGQPADIHRTIRSPWVRSRLWDASRDLDEQRVARPLLPFVLDALVDRRLVPTDDTETAALALCVLNELGEDALPDALFEAWQQRTTGADVWGGVAERAAARNAAQGLRPPVTGTDHPADTSDSAVPAGIAAGIALRHDPSAASRFTRQWAAITHHSDGLDAAVFAASVAAHLSCGQPLEEAVAMSSEVLPAGWLSYALHTASTFNLTSPNDFLVALPRLLKEYSPRTYSAGSIAPQTLPLAYLILHAVKDQPQLAVPLAMMFPRHSDSLPAIVGGLASATHGAALFEPTYSTHLDLLEGILYPTLAGVNLRVIAAETAQSVEKPEKHVISAKARL